MIGIAIKCTEPINPLTTNKQSNIFTVLFYLEAISMLYKLSESISIHKAFTNIIDNVPPINSNEIEGEFNKKLGMFVSLNINDRLQDNHPNKVYNIKEEDVIIAVTTLFKNLLSVRYSRIPPRDTIEYMLNGYPLSIISDVCQGRKGNSHVIGECVKKLIKMKIPTPPNLYNVIEGFVPLTGHPDSPLTCDKLECIHNYLGSKKSAYVHILLNCTYEISTHTEIMDKVKWTQDDILTICHSSWFFLFTITTERT